MATMAELRQRLARAVDAYNYGTVTANGTNLQIIDDDQLAQWTAVDDLLGSTAYILATTDGLAPEDEGRIVANYFPANYTPGSLPTLTMVYAFTDPPQIGDVYELFRVPYMGIGDWNECINRAIRAAWPELYITGSATLVPGADLTASYTLPAAALAVDSVLLQPADRLRGYPVVTARREIDYTIGGLPGSLALLWKRAPLAADYYLHVVYRAMYPVLAWSTSVSVLDEEYTLAQARAEFYEYRANKTRLESDAGTYLQLVTFYRGEAQKRKAALLAMTSGQPLQVGGS